MVMFFGKRVVIVFLAGLLAFGGLLGVSGGADAAAVEIVPNASVETASATNANQPQDWQTGNWGTNTATFSYVAGDGQNGTHSLKVQMTSYTDGDAKWYFTPQAITGGSQYVFSDYYKSTVATQVVAQFDNGNNGYTYATLGTAAASASTWSAFNTSFSAPAAAKNVTIFHLIDSVGSLQTDTFSLTSQVSSPSPSPTPTPTTPVTGNLIANPSFETQTPGNSSLPYHWQSGKWGTNTAAFSYLSKGLLTPTDAHTGSRAVQIKMSGYSSGDAKWYADPVSVTPRTQYRYSDYYKATIQTEVDVAFTMADGSTTYELIGLPDSATSWTKFSTTFTVPDNAISMTVYHLIRGNGTLSIDDADLEKYTPVGFNQALVTITFDDGYASDYTNALPLLQKYGLTSTSYIISGLIGQPDYLSLDQLKTLAATQEIGSHTVTHADLSSKSKSAYTKELANAQTQLRQWTGQQITNFAYPEGLYNGGTTSVAKKYYASTRGVEAGLNSKDTFNAYDIKVQNIDENTAAATVAGWVAQAQATKTWLVLVYHSVSSDPNDAGDYTITPAQLDSQLAVIKSSGVTVKTMQQALTDVKAQL